MLAWVGLSALLLGGCSTLLANVSDRLAASPPGRQCIVKPGTVYDGDTARFLCDRDEIKVRFCGIDAPEAEQPGGIDARDYLRSLLPDRAPVTIVPVEEDRYGRLVAEVWREAIAPEPNLNVAMVLAGQAWHYEQYSRNCPSRDAIAAAAETAGPMAGMPPWEWRRQN
jgi:endonuclease YncB( thermonuclease family)